MMSAAAEIGIDSCLIEGFNINEAEKYLSEKGFIDLNEFGSSYMVGFDYRNEERSLKKR